MAVCRWETLGRVLVFSSVVCSGSYVARCQFNEVAYGSVYSVVFTKGSLDKSNPPVSICAQALQTLGRL